MAVITSAHGTTLRYLQGCRDDTCPSRDLRVGTCTNVWQRWMDHRNLGAQVPNNAAGARSDRKRLRGEQCPYGHVRTSDNTITAHDVTGRPRRTCLDCRPHLRKSA